MGIKQDPDNGTWSVSYTKRHPETRQPVGLRRKGIPTKAEAQRVERELVLAVEERLKRAVVPTWERVVEEYLCDAEARGLQHITFRTWEGWLRSNTWHLRDVTLDTINGGVLRDVVFSVMKDSSDTHRKNVLKTVRRVFDFAVEREYVARNPTPHIAFRVGDKLKGVLTEEQARRLLDEARSLASQWYPHWAMAIYTGMRNGELFALTWDKVNVGDRLIRVDAAWNHKDGFKSTKSGDDRMVEIAPALLPVLRDLRALAKNDDFVLPRVPGWSKGQQANELRKFLLGMGLPPVRFHDLRASWATLLLGKGIAPIRVMAMGGWKDLKTMMIYVRKAGIDIRGCSDVLTIHDHHQSRADVIPLNAKREIRGTQP